MIQKVYCLGCKLSFFLKKKFSRLGSINATLSGCMHSQHLVESIKPIVNNNLNALICGCTFHPLNSQTNITWSNFIIICPYMAISILYHDRNYSEGSDSVAWSCGTSLSTRSATTPHNSVWALKLGRNRLPSNYTLPWILSLVISVKVREGNFSLSILLISLVVAV